MRRMPFKPGTCAACPAAGIRPRWRRHCLPPRFLILLHPLAFVLCAFLAGCSIAPVDERIQRLNDDGVFLYQKGDYARARENFELALSLRSEDPGLLYNVGQCYEHQGNAKKAEEFYRLCLKKVPDHVEGQQALAMLLVKQGRKTEAKEAVQNWLVSQPKVADAYAQDGWRLYQDGDLLSAQGRVQQALELDPNNVSALIQMGYLYELTERPDRALVLYEKALAREPSREDLRQRINQLLARGVKAPVPDS